MKHKKTAETTGDLIDNKIGNKITGVSKYSQQNNSERVANERYIAKERNILPEERQKIIDNLIFNIIV